MTREEEAAYQKEYRFKNKVELARKRNDYQLKNAAKIREGRRIYRLKNAKVLRAKATEWARNNRERYLTRLREYSKRDSVRKRRVEYRRHRRNTVPWYRIKCALTNRVATTLRERGLKKENRRTMEIVGCEIPFLLNHLERQFVNGMTWENHGFGEGKWHIDHKIPCAAFDLTDIEQQGRCFHYSNLQPLWSRDNLFKSDRII